MKYLRYLRTVLRHKWFVFLASWHLGVPWLGLTHDLSKFLPDEFFPYAEYFEGGYPRNGHPAMVKHDFDVAWLKHQHRNKHHWQHWVLRLDDGATALLEMPECFILEMVADWKGAGRAYGNPDTRAWYASRKERGLILLETNTRTMVEQLLGLEP